MAVQQRQIWRVGDLLLWAKNYLREKGIETPQLEAELLIRAVLNCSRLDVYLRHEQPLSSQELAQFKALLLKRVSGQPIQYVLGKTEFMGLELEVNPDVLIPRPETEILVEEVLRRLRAYPEKELRLLDIGTGSGCIALAIAYNLPNCHVHALDISLPALKVAQLNAQRLNLTQRLSFHHQDILKEAPRLPGKLDCIVSNPPYVSGEWVQRLPAVVRNHEPHIALFPGDDGLLFYRRIVQLGPLLLQNGALLAVEIGGTYQEKAVSELLQNAKFAAVEVIKDYSGQSRVIIGKWVE